MAEPVTITADNFETEVLRATGPVLVDFWAPWCGPCRVIGPVVEEFATQYAGKLKVGKLNVDENQSIATDYEIRGIPALLFFNNGQVVDTVVGGGPGSEYKRMLKEHIDSVITQFSPA